MYANDGVKNLTADFLVRITVAWPSGLTQDDCVGGVKWDDWLGDAKQDDGLGGIKKDDWHNFKKHQTLVSWTLESCSNGEFPP